MFGGGPTPTPTSDVPEFEEDEGAGGKRNLTEDVVIDKDAIRREQLKKLDRDDEEIMAILVNWYINMN